MKIATPLKKSPYFFPTTTLLKTKVLSSPPPHTFWKFGRRFNPLLGRKRRAGVHTILRLIVKRFQRFCHLLWDSDILFEKLTPEIGSWIWKTSFANNAFGAGDFLQSLSYFLISPVVTCNLCLLYRALLDLPKYWSESWRRYNLKVVYCCGDGEVAR